MSEDRKLDLLKKARAAIAEYAQDIHAIRGDPAVPWQREDAAGVKLLQEIDEELHEQTMCSMCEGIDDHLCVQCRGEPMGYWYREDCQCRRCRATRLQMPGLKTPLNEPKEKPKN